ncbi:MAG: hypothetical protein QXK74_06295 [Candidatus Nitrosocaldaceae archaeon]
MYKNIFVVTSILTLLIPLNVYAQESKLVFKNILVDDEILPFQDFNITATISNIDNQVVYENVIVKLVVPGSINVIDNVIKNLGDIEPGRDEITRWTLQASEIGSFNIKLFLYSSGIEVSSFDLVINVGSSKSIILYDIDLPGNIRVGDKFNYTIIVKNIAQYKIDNAIFSIGLGAGLHALDEITKTVDIEPQETIEIKWLIRADATGSFKIVVNYFTQHNESNTFETFVNVGGIINIGNIVVSRVYWGIDREIVALPGSENIPLTLVLTNIGEVQLNDIRLEIDASKPFVINNNVKEFKVLQPNKDIPVTFLVSIDRDANVGLYPLSITLSSSTYEQKKSDEIYVVVTKNIPIMIDIKDVERNGNIFTSKLSIYNNSSATLHNVMISTRDSSISILKTSTIDILGANEEKESILEFSLTQSIYEEVLPINIKLAYLVNGAFLSSDDTLIIPITTKLNTETPFIIRNINVEPSLVYSGDSAKINIDIQNNDLFVYSNIYAKLMLVDGFTPTSSKSDESNISKIRSFENSTLTFFINVDDNIPASEYTFKLLLQFNNQTLEYTIPFMVSPKARFEVLSVDSSQLYVGVTSVPLKITIKNAGETDAENIVLKLLGGNILPGSRSTVVTTVGDTELIGKLGKEQTTTATFIINVDKSATAGNNIISLEISWEQNDGNSFTTTIPFSININKSSSSLIFDNIFDNPSITMLLTAIISGIIVFTFIHFRNRKIEQTKT